MTAPLFRLTDEELQLFGAAGDVDTPYLDRLGTAQRSVAVDVAYRALCAHGVALEAGEGLLMPDELVHLLQVRANPERSYRIEVCAEGARSLRHVYDAGGTTVCEDISNDGLHDFDVLPAGRSVQLVLAALTPELQSEPDGVSVRGRVVVSPWSTSEPAPWGRALATADVTVRAPGQAATTVCVVWGDSGTYVVSPAADLTAPDARGLCRMIAAHLGIEQAS
ncbi:hypothetical protein [Allobranchiibius huperziae]|uniref:ESX secretion-associated protein EspG n=1 Tax=Allobranchiibius huperziae TaxID=1874116 RepID=A0A853DC29_9MICO|nr:hypothetical protein [Allobranchiibius huperziae]NYJ74157.1 hypothetical protein [Allobranchiibius huperziae]